MDRSWAVSSLLENFKNEDFPENLILSLNRRDNEQFISSLSIVSLEPHLTDEVIVLFKPELVEISANWLASTDLYSVCIAFAKALPYAHYLQVRAITFFENALRSGSFLDFLGNDYSSIQNSERLCRLLLAVIRLLIFDNTTYRKYVSPSIIYNLIYHTQDSVKYLAIQTLALYLGAADAAIESIVQRIIGRNEILGRWEELKIDYQFLTLWEEMRNERLLTRLSRTRDISPEPKVDSRRADKEKNISFPSDLTIDVWGILLPLKTRRTESSAWAALVVATSTTVDNCRKIASALLDSSLLLITGQPGSGKSFLLKQIAYRLQKPNEIATLHLNESTDLKSLIGLYTSDSLETGLTWRPGLLTDAVRNGYWLILEDIERARAEALSLLISLIENGTLYIPATGETVRASPNFKIIAISRSEMPVDHVGSLALPGARLWKIANLVPLSKSNIQLIISESYPHAQSLTEKLADTFTNLKSFESKEMSKDSYTNFSERALWPKDLFKLCRRISVSMQNSITYSEGSLDSIYLDAVDVFTACIVDTRKRKDMMSIIAEHLHVSPRKKRYLLEERKIDFTGYEYNQPLLIAGRTMAQKFSTASKTGYLKLHRDYALSRQNLVLLEQILAAVNGMEPVLIVGDTGIGKTASVQYLAQILRFKLSIINVSQQTEPTDLVGGLKPINVRHLVNSMNSNFYEIFQSSFPFESNSRFYDMLSKSIAKGQWKRVLAIWREALTSISKSATRKKTVHRNASFPSKKRRVDSTTKSPQLSPWQAFEEKLNHLESQIDLGPNKQAFGFTEGLLVQAMKRGEWVLLDEINLASSEILECIGDLVKSTSESVSSLYLQGNGFATNVQAHPNFRLFAAMNPANEVGRTTLMPSVRSCFTEIYYDSPENNWESLKTIVEKYIGNTLPGETFSSLISNLYLKIKVMTSESFLLNGDGRKPIYSLRTLVRALVFARDLTRHCSLRRAIYEGFKLGFSTSLQKSSLESFEHLIVRTIFDKESVKIEELGKPIRPPSNSDEWLEKEGFWLMKGSFINPCSNYYVMTPYIRKNLSNLCRAVSAHQFPILIEGPTATGKTSMIEYLAAITNHKIIRINNHEHTDIQEYLGKYIQAENGMLRFEEGPLIRALRSGHWVILDELNLAPCEVLEALNRLLDDNREMLVPETQEIVQPHSHFMLFATQNPAGEYGGRKTLSSPFRNRFLELYFDDIPLEELVIILYQKTKTPKSWCEKIAAVYRELGKLRNADHVFELSRVVTLRDLFRWALREAASITELANNGYMLLAERARRVEERDHIKSIIERIFSDRGPRIQIDPLKLYNEQFSSQLGRENTVLSDGHIVWTSAMKRLSVLVWKAMQNDEPLLLVGETGSGKTTICEAFAKYHGKTLFTLNAHQNIESSDLIGSQRPVRNREYSTSRLRRCVEEILRLNSLRVTNLDEGLSIVDALPDIALKKLPQELLHSLNFERLRLKKLFEWTDGSLVQAMKLGQYFLFDEISLANDSVLERLNSLLEPNGKLFMTEKGVENALITRSPGFQFFATMNPSGDYGKRELSPALRNRFTEIWVPSTTSPKDLLHITQSMLQGSRASIADNMVHFAQWFTGKYCQARSHSLSIRDVATWATFVNNTPYLDIPSSFVHGAALVFIDSVGAQPGTGPQIQRENVSQERQLCLKKLGVIMGKEMPAIYDISYRINVSLSSITIGPFHIERKSDNPLEGLEKLFSMQAPTVSHIMMRIFRALQLDKPILLEGDPGVGKTALINAIAILTGNSLVRTNLSEQTDITDLLGSDSPAEGEGIGSFVWKDAPVLKAMKLGQWVLLDEINLASQSILEGLNSCIDHRGQCFVPELDRTFPRHPQFRLFATQNPHSQGYGRKGLPQAFVNRFTVVFADQYKANDQLIICKDLFPNFNEKVLMQMIKFSSEVIDLISGGESYGTDGGPWDFNLRDLLRWIYLLKHKEGNQIVNPGYYLKSLFLDRFHGKADIDNVTNSFTRHFSDSGLKHPCTFNIINSHFQIGLACFPRNLQTESLNQLQYSFESQQDLSLYESTLLAVEMAWPVILVGRTGSGKSTMIHNLASIAATNVVTIPLNRDTDISDLIGGLEQTDYNRDIRLLLPEIHATIRSSCINQLLNNSNIELMTSSLETLCLVDRLQADIIDLDVEKMSNMLDNICALSKSSDLKQLLTSFQKATELRYSSRAVQFQWVNGPLIRALEEGSWVILDNANTCNSSVLDRLNSLLETDRYLCIHENCSQDGNPRFIRAHPNFRIFMTSCPSNGQLSRAIRNRSVEIYLPSTSTNVEHLSTARMRRVNMKQSSVFRFRRLKRLYEAYTSKSMSRNALAFGIAHLSFNDLTRLQSFKKQISIGLLSCVDDLRLGDILRSIDTYFQKYKEFDWKDVSDRVFRKCDMESSKNIDDKIILRVIHPRENMNLATILRKNTMDLYASGALHEIFVDLVELSEKSQIENEPELSVPYLHLDSFVPQDSPNSRLKKILHALLGLLWKYVQSVFHVFDRNRQIEHGLRRVLDLCFNLSQLIESGGIDEPKLRALLMFLEEELMDIACSDSADGLNGAPRFELLEHVIEVKRHQSGQSMQRLWNYFQGPTFSNSLQSENATQLANLSDRFDILKWRQKALEVEELLGIQDALIDASCSLTSTDNMDNLSYRHMEHAIINLENRSRSNFTMKPYFASDFRFIYQNFQLACINSSTFPKRFLSILRYLGDFNTKLQFPINRALTSSPVLNKIMSYFLDHENMLDMMFGHRWLLSLLSRIDNIKHLQVEQCEWLQEEMNVMKMSLAGLQRTPVVDRVKDLARSLKEILCSVFTLHEEFFESIEQDGIPGVMRLSQAEKISWRFNFKKAEPKNLYFQRICNEYFCNTVDFFFGEPKFGIDNLKALARAWACLGSGCLLLYVPNLPMDPGLLPLLRKDFCVHTKDRYKQKLDDISQAERTIFQTYNSLHCQSYQNIIDSLGPEPIVRKVYRPTNAETMSLEDIYVLVLELLGQFERSCLYNFDCLREPVLLDRIQMLVERLSKPSTAYHDIKNPIVAFLNCLSVGCHLASNIGSNNLNTSCTSAVIQQIPFLISNPEDWRLYKGLLELKNDRESSEKMVLALCSIALHMNTMHLTEYPAWIEDDTLRLYNRVYYHWRTLLADEQEHDQKRRLDMYYFRSKTSSDTDKNSHNSKETLTISDSKGSSCSENTKELSEKLSVTLADVHHLMFGEEQSVENCMKCLINQALRTIVQDSSQQLQFNITEKLDKGLHTLILLYLHSIQRPERSYIAHDYAYDFNETPNLCEALKFQKLLRSIQLSILNENKEQTEDGNVLEILDICRQALSIRVEDPLSVFLQMSERLYFALSDWDKLRSKHLNIYTLELARLIYRWRNLEVQSWKTILDAEDRRCSASAKRWWFVMYESIIIGTYRACEENNLKEYRKKLVVIVEDFFSSASSGQFQQRLTMIKAFSKHLLLLAETKPIVLSIYEAVASVLDYFARYEVEIRSSISNTNKSLAKDFGEVVRIATLKDRDVRKLRESAHSSWKKILKLKKIYQELLDQPTDLSFNRRLPHIVTETNSNISTDNVNLSFGHLHLADLSIPGSDQRREPYNDILSTVKAMSLVVDMNSVIVQCTKNVADMRLSLQNLSQDISEQVVKKPPKLSRYVIQKKRQLFNDVKRSLRELGFDYRVREDAPKSQISTVEILASLPSLPNVSFGNEPLAREYFYGFIQEMPNVRKLQQHHTQNLAHSEVIQFTEYTENLLKFLADQRNGLLIVLKSFLNVESIILKIRPYLINEAFSAHESGIFIYERSSLRDKIKILPALITLSIDVLRAQDQGTEYDVRKIENFMLKWQGVFQLAYRKICNIPPIVYGLGSETGKKVCEDIEASLLQFVQDLHSWRRPYPAFTHIVEKLILWTTQPYDIKTESDLFNASDVHAMSQNFFDLLDLMLGSIQDVKTCIAETETSVESNNWLYSVDKDAKKILHVFKFNSIEQQLTRILRYKTGAKKPHKDIVSCMNGLFKSLGPIIEQYRRISISFISRYTDLHGALCYYSYFIITTFKEICREEFWVSNEEGTKETFLDETKGDKVGLGEGTGAENADNSIEDGKDVADFDNLENQNDITDDMLEEDALELGEDSELGNVRDNVTHDTTVEENLNDEKREIEEKIEQTGQSAEDEKLWDKGDMEEDSQAKIGQGLSAGSAAARETAESMSEPLQTQGKQELKKQSKADMASTKSERERIEETIILDDQESADLTDEYDSHVGQTDVMENEDIDSAFEDYSKTHSPSASNIEETNGADSSTLHSENLSEASNIVDIDSCEGKSPLLENFDLDQAEGGEADLIKQSNDRAEESKDLTVRPDVAESEINQQAWKEQRTRELGSIGTGQKQRQSTRDKQIMEDDPDFSAYQRNDNIDDDPSSQKNMNHQLTVWKALGSELEEWVTSQVDIAQERSAEQQNIDIEMADMQSNIYKDNFLEEQALLRPENGMTLDAQDGEEQTQSESVTDVFAKERYYESIIAPEQGNAVKKLPLSKEAIQNASKYAQDIKISKYERSKLLNRDETKDDYQNISTVKLWDNDRSILSHSEKSGEVSTNENIYQDLSQVLAEQLRLILEPTKSTKFRGDFRTGKKLNIRRIIPYIASGGKRDKIWMRRTVPSKRAYQIMLALDDSKSMIESDSVSPALQSLALISKALAIVEAGELCVVAFGEDCRIALDFGTPFVHETQNLFRKSFTFTQSRTDIRALIEATIAHFRKARSKAAYSESHLWQLQLIISDGICEEHEAIKKLVSQAEQERIMIVFIIMDFGTQATEVGQDVSQRSILDLQTATFTSDAENNIVVKRQYYMDTFPFKWYLLVRNIKDLPFALTTALRQWFAEVTFYDN